MQNSMNETKKFIMNHNNHRLNNQQFWYKSRWRGSINQLSKMEEESKMVKLDTVYKKISSLKLQMKNRLGQIDQEWNPVVERKKADSINKSISKHQIINKMVSTAHDSNVLTSLSSQQQKLQRSIILTSAHPNPQQTHINTQIKPYTCHPIRQQLIQELTEYNKQKYDNEMKQQCSKYSESIKSMFYSLINSEKKHIYQFCYMCDEVVEDTQKQEKKEKHQCTAEINSISRVNEALERLKCFIEKQNNKIFHVFFHNALQPAINIDELISNLAVLKQSIHLNYDPEEILLRLRLMNLMGKKIGLLIEEKDLQERLKSICKSKK